MARARSVPNPLADLARMHEKARLQRIVLHHKACQKLALANDRAARKDQGRRDALLAMALHRYIRITFVCLVVGIVVAWEKYFG